MRRLILPVVLSIPLWASASSTPETWGAKCKSCHGVDGKGQTKLGQKERVKDLTTAEYQGKKTDEDIRKAIADGVAGTKLKPFKDKLSAEDVSALVKHVRSLK